jgi:hypothetical protein
MLAKKDSVCSIKVDMHSVEASAPSNLVDSLDFSLGNTAAYVTSRVQTQYVASGGSSYGTNQTKEIRFHMAGETGWIDPQSVRIQFKVTNNTSEAAAHPLVTSTSIPSCVFDRLVLKIGGQVTEDINSLGRVSSMFHQMTTSHAHEDMEREGFLAKNGANTLAQNATCRVLLKPLSGIFSQSKMLPLKMCAGITLDLHCADIGDFATGANAAALPNSYQITEPVLLVDVIELDSALQEQYVQFVLTQNPMPIVYSQYIVTEQQLVGAQTTFNVNMARGCSRLQSVFWSLQETADNYPIPKTTNFFRPHTVDDFQWSVRIGAKKFPLSPVTGFAESRSKLAQAVGINSSTCFSLLPTATEYASTKFVAGVDVEKIVGASFSGLDTRSGDQITIECKGFEGTAQMITVVLLCQCVLNIRDSGVDVLQ